MHMYMKKHNKNKHGICLQHDFPFWTITLVSLYSVPVYEDQVPVEMSQNTSKIERKETKFEEDKSLGDSICF